MDPISEVVLSQRWWGTQWPSSTLASPLKRAPYARQSIDKVSRDYSCQYVAVSESNSQDFEVPIPLGRHGRGG
jgi:hypothetical protein